MNLSEAKIAFYKYQLFTIRDGFYGSFYTTRGSIDYDLFKRNEQTNIYRSRYDHVIDWVKLRK